MRRDKSNASVLALASVVLFSPIYRTASAQCETKHIPTGSGSGSYFGYSVASSGNYAVAGFPWFTPPRKDWGVDFSGAVWVFQWDGDGWIEQAGLVRNDSGASGDSPGYISRVGASVDISGDYIVAGDPTGQGPVKDSGAAYVWRRDGDNWIEETKLLADDAEPDDLFGFSVAISGDYAAVGAPVGDSLLPGKAYVFKREGNDWIQQAKISASDARPEDSFGFVVSISGDYIAIGATLKDDLCPEDPDCNSGAAYIFRREGEKWLQDAKLTPDDLKPGHRFGQAVSILGDRVIVGAIYDDDACPGDPECHSGSAYVFRREQDGWIQEAKLTARQAQRFDTFGRSVALGENFAAVGARRHDVSLDLDPGAVHTFRRDGTTWSHQAKLTANDGRIGDWFGQSVAINGGSVLVGAPLDDRRPPDDEIRQTSGSLYVYSTDFGVPVGTGDANRDGVVDLLDILCVLDGFAGNFQNCTFEAVDIRATGGECGRDGVIDLNDILGVLNAFSGSGG